MGTERPSLTVVQNPNGIGGGREGGVGLPRTVHTSPYPQWWIKRVRDAVVGFWISLEHFHLGADHVELPREAVLTVQHLEKTLTY